MSAQDGFGVAEGGVGSISTNGAAGSDNGSSWAIGTGAIVGLIVGIVIVIIAIGVMWWLWWTTKNYQMTKREALKRASRRMAGRTNPPRTPRLPPDTARSARTPGFQGPSSRNRPIDLEKAPKHKTAGIPSPGWLEDEKERSRTRSPDRNQPPRKTAGLVANLKLALGRR